MVQGKGSVTYFERVEYVTKNKETGEDKQVKGYIAHCQVPVEKDEELLGFKVCQCWVNDENKLKVQTGSSVRVRYGKFGQYIEEVLPV